MTLYILMLTHCVHAYCIMCLSRHNWCTHACLLAWPVYKLMWHFSTCYQSLAKNYRPIHKCIRVFLDGVSWSTFVPCWSVELWTSLICTNSCGCWTSAFMSLSRTCGHKLSVKHASPLRQYHILFFFSICTFTQVWITLIYLLIKLCDLCSGFCTQLSIPK